VPVTIEDCKLDLAGHTFVDGSGREVRLTRAETALMTAFVDSPRRVLSRDHSVSPSPGVARNPMTAASICSSPVCGAR